MNAATRSPSRRSPRRSTLPLLGAYSASKAGVEALANTLRIELAPSGARVGVAYFAELDTDMVRRGFGTAAAKRGDEIRRPAARVSPLEVGIDAIERGIARRSRRVVAPRWVAAALPMRMLVQRAVELATRSSMEELLEIARAEDAPANDAPARRSTRARRKLLPASYRGPTPGEERPWRSTNERR